MKSFSPAKRHLLYILLCLCSAIAQAQHTPTVAAMVDLGYGDDVFRDNALYWGQGVSGSGKTPFAPMYAALTSGSAQADIRTLTFEDGSPLIHDGCLYYSMTSRTAGAGLCIYRLTLGTGQLSLCGIVRGRVVEEGAEPAFWRMAAGHLMYHRPSGLWQLTASCHAGEVTNRRKPIHRLYVATSRNDLRYGVNTIDCTPLQYQSPQQGDEDGQVYYDDELRRWVLVYASRFLPDGTKSPHYILRLQTSKHSNHGFSGHTCATDLNATGITCTRVGGLRCVLSGDQASEGRNVYRAYTYSHRRGEVEFSPAGQLDIDLTDGGFRGWNNVTPIPDGAGTRYVLLTFDRTPSTQENNWTYGRLYLYYSAQTNKGCEFNVRDLSGRLIARADVDPRDSLTLQVSQLQFRRMSSLHPQFDEMRLGQFSAHTPITQPHGNAYPVVRGQVRYADGQLWPDAQDNEADDAPLDACLLVGTHYAMSNYLLPLQGIAMGDSRYLYLGDAQGHAHCRVVATRTGEGYQLTLHGPALQVPQSVCTLPAHTPLVRLAFVIPTETHSTPYRLFVFR